MVLAIAAVGGAKRTVVEVRLAQPSSRVPIPAVMAEPDAPSPLSHPPVACAAGAMRASDAAVAAIATPRGTRFLRTGAFLSSAVVHATFVRTRPGKGMRTPNHPRQVVAPK